MAPALSWELRPGTFVVDAPFGAPLFSGPGAARKVWPADSDGRLSPAAVCFRPCGRLSHTAHAELVDLTRVGSTLWGRLVSPPTFDAGCQLRHAERLRQVIVRAHLQAQDPIQLCALCRQHQNRHIARAGTNLAAHRQTIQARQHQIQNNQIDAALTEPFQAGVPPVHEHGLHSQI